MLQNAIQYRFSSSKKGFTLIEVIFSMTVFFIIVSIVLGLYRQMIQIKNDINAKQILIQWSYFTMEKIQLLLKNYLPDYEEYFNRRLVGCTTTWNASWNVGTWGYCTVFTAYGNRNSIQAYARGGEHKYYYCSSQIDQQPPSNPAYVFSSAELVNGTWCYQSVLWRFSVPAYQAFGQYKVQHRDVKNEVNAVNQWAVGDDDDKDLGKGPDALLSSTGVQELYLISPDQTSRVYIRRVLVESGDRNRDGLTGNVDTDNLYTLQVLKLRWFDGWSLHNFSVSTSSGVYDGQIDTWACDYAQWFVCSWSGVSSLYSWFNLPNSVDDGWVNLFGNDVTISRWSLIISPTKLPFSTRDEIDTQINPFIRILFETKLYGRNWSSKIPYASLQNYKLTLQTTFNIKQWY